MRVREHARTYTHIYTYIYIYIYIYNQWLFYSGRGGGSLIFILKKSNVVATALFVQNSQNHLVGD